jgi:hypothetical protein
LGALNALLALNEKIKESLPVLLWTAEPVAAAMDLSQAGVPICLVATDSNAYLLDIKDAPFRDRITLADFSEDLNLARTSNSVLCVIPKGDENENLMIWTFLKQAGIPETV